MSTFVHHHFCCKSHKLSSLSCWDFLFALGSNRANTGAVMFGFATKSVMFADDLEIKTIKSDFCQYHPTDFITEYRLL